MPRTASSRDARDRRCCTPGGAAMSVVARGFRRRESRTDDRLPPGQYDVGGSFPVLSAGPTPRTPLSEWDLTIQGELPAVRRWSWGGVPALPPEAISLDIHCVT